MTKTHRDLVKGEIIEPQDQYRVADKWERVSSLTVGEAYTPCDGSKAWVHVPMRRPEKTTEKEFHAEVEKLEKFARANDVYLDNDAAEVMVKYLFERLAQGECSD